MEEVKNIRIAAAKAAAEAVKAQKRTQEANKELEEISSTVSNNRNIYVNYPEDQGPYDISTSNDGGIVNFARPIKRVKFQAVLFYGSTAMYSIRKDNYAGKEIEKFRLNGSGEVDEINFEFEDDIRSICIVKTSGIEAASSIKLYNFEMGSVASK